MTDHGALIFLAGNVNFFLFFAGFAVGVLITFVGMLVSMYRECVRKGNNK